MDALWIVDVEAKNFISESMGGGVHSLRGSFCFVVRRALINVKSSGLVHVPQGGCQEFFFFLNPLISSPWDYKGSLH